MKFVSASLKLAVLTTALFTIPVFAQRVVIARADIPFTFQVGGKSLPAGQYTLVGNPGSLIMTVQGASGQPSVMTFAGPCHKTVGPDVAKLTFNVYGNVRFLKDVWIPDGSGRSLTTSKAEREAAKAHTAYEVALLVVPAQ